MRLQAIALLLLAVHQVAALSPNVLISGVSKQTSKMFPSADGVLFLLRERDDTRGAATGCSRLLLSSTGGTNEAPSWRYEVDALIKAASPWGSIVETEIIATDLLKRLPEVTADVSDAVRRGTLFSGVVLARGTEARYTVDGLKAVNRQLREDILPKAIESAPCVRKSATGSRTKTKPSDAGVSATRRGKDSAKITGPIEGVVENLYSIRKAVKGLSPRKVREGLKTVASETQNIVSRTPSGLYSPEYSVLETKEGFEIRRYASYAVCSATMPEINTAAKETTLNGDVGTTAGSGEGFNILAGYLFGNNTQERAMDMTTPVNIDVSPAAGRTMSFVMPKDISAGEAPTPRDSRVGVSDVADGEILAVRDFPGFATDSEVQRQLDSLLGALQRETTLPWSEFSGQTKGDPSEKKEGSSSPVSRWRPKDPSGLSFRLMQYNPPYTLPWLRTNAVAVKVFEDGVGGVGEEGDAGTAGVNEE